jgi:hypothetical protein
MTDTASVTTFVMGARFPWEENVSPVGDEGPFDSGIIHDSGFRQECSIRKISALGATVQASVQQEPGELVTIELSSGQRTPATVKWAKGAESGLAFEKPIDVLALINRNLVSQPIDRRSMPRVEIRCAAFVKCGEDFIPATLRNISASGLQLEGDRVPAAGAFVSIFIEGLNIPGGEVVWSKGNACGIELFQELSWSSLMPWVRTQTRRSDS